jgi:predicted NBD/HSP70 family sugar kinase
MGLEGTSTNRPVRAVVLGQRSETVRRSNLSAVLRALHERGPQSRSELVTGTGLTRSAIRSLVGELALVGLVTEARAEARGRPGRPSPVVRPVPDGAVALALEIAVDSLAVALVGLGGDVLFLERVDRSRDRASVEATIEALVDLAGSAREVPGRADPLVGVGVAVVGVVRRADGSVAMAPNLGWKDVPLGALLATALAPTAPIAVANEADLGALAELRRGAAIGRDDILFVSGEVGVGGGLITGGRPLTGAAGYGGEIGHIPVRPDGRPCRCGSNGCWETEVGEEALLLRAGLPSDGGRAGVETVMHAAADGDTRALEALADVGRWLGIGLAGLVNVLDPRLVVLGGRLARIHPFVIGPVESELRRRALPAARALVSVVPARLGADAPLIGAAELAFEPLLADPVAVVAERGSALIEASA